MQTNEKLDELSAYQTANEVLTKEKQALVDAVMASIMTDEVKQKLADIDAEFIGKTSVVSAKISDLDAEIRKDVLNLGKTVPGKFLMAVWNKGRTTWDTSGLIGYAVAHPEMDVFKHIGEPTVTIRKSGKGE